MKSVTAKRLIRDGMSVAGLVCLGVAAWWVPAILCVYGGVVLLATAVLWQRYEWIKSKGSNR